MKAWILPVLAGGALAIGLAASASASPPESGTADGPGVWKDADAPRRIRALARPVEQALGWPGVGDYLVALAYGESRGVSTACRPPCGPGWSRGWFQIRPVAKCYSDLGLTNYQFLHTEAAQVAVAICHARRLGIIYDEPGQTVQWQDIRRGWKYPGWVAASKRDDPDTQGTLRAFERNIENVGLPTSFAKRRAFPPGLDVPDVHTIYNLAKKGAP